MGTSKNTLREFPLVITTAAKISRKYGLWLVVRVNKKKVPWHILAPRAVACDSLHLRASAHYWHVSAFLCNGEFLGISCYIKKTVHQLVCSSKCILFFLCIYPRRSVRSGGIWPPQTPSHQFLSMKERSPGTFPCILRTVLFSRKYKVRELPIVLSQWASCFIDLVTYYLHRR